MKPDYTRLAFPEPPANGRPYVLLNMAMTIDGQTVVDGGDEGIGSQVDRRLMRELRVHADVILWGAGTLRVNGGSPRLGDPKLESLRAAAGKRRLAIGAVLTESGDLPLGRPFFTASDFESFVYAGPGCPRPRRDTLAGTGRPVVALPDPPLPAMLQHMRRELGAGLLLLEGGPTLNRSFFAADAVDEVFVTVGPVIAGTAGTSGLLGAGPEPAVGRRRFGLVGCIGNDQTSEVYLHYRRRR